MALTSAQQQARLDPEAFTVNVPSTGLFRGKGSLGQLFKREGDKVTQINFVNLLVPASERTSLGNFGAQTRVAEQRLKERYNIDLNSLPEVNIADLAQSRGSAVAGQKLAPRIGQPTGVSDINQFLGVTQAQIQEAKQNTQQNKLAEGQVDTTTPDLNQFGNFDRELQFGSTGEDVKRLQQFLNASGFEVGKEGTAGSLGNETEFFGPKTQKALQEFQKAQGIVDKGDPTTTGFGRFGPQTMQSVNKLTVTPTAPSGTEAPTQDTGGVGAPTDDTQVLPKTSNPEIDRAFQDLMNNPNLTDDQKKVAETMFDLISRNDKEQAQRFAAAFEAGTEFSDPFFNAQVNMVLAGLRSGLASDAGDLEFEEKQLADLRDKTDADLAASRGQLSFEKEQELKNLQKQLGLDLETNAQNLAAVGKTSSSVRAKSEGLLRETKEGLVESKERRFGFEVSKGERDVAFKQTQISDELKRLQDKATQDRIADLRGAEEKVGSKRLLGLGGLGDLSGLVGGVGGSIERERIRSGLSFAGGFVF